MSDLPPGPELDALIASSVMGWTELMIHGGGVPRYSTSIADAWTVVEKLTGKGGRFHLVLHPESGWSAFFSYHFAEVPTAPLAICYAALKAVGK